MARRDPMSDADAEVKARADRISAELVGLIGEAMRLSIPELYRDAARNVLASDPLGRRPGPPVRDELARMSEAALRAAAAMAALAARYDAAAETFEAAAEEGLLPESEPFSPFET
jgi:hypothetical protein